MKKIITTLTIAVSLTLVSAMVANAAGNTVSSGTTGTGATASTISPSVELYTPAGGTGSAYIRLSIPGGIALNAITSLQYTAQVTTPGAGGFAPEVILNIDANNNGVLDGTGIDWMQSSHSPAALNGDNFLSGDQNPATITVADSGFVIRDALTGYSYWDASADGTTFGTLPYSPFASIAGLLPSDNITATSKVYSIDFVVGTSGNFDGMRALFNSVELNGTTYLLGNLSAQDFGVVVNYNNGQSGQGLLTGYATGFGLTDATFAGATSVVVQLFAAGNQLLQTNTAILPKFNADVTGTQFSSPFDVSGTFNYPLDGYWTNVREAQYGQSVPATKVVATVTLANGKVVTAENDILTGDPTSVYPASASVTTNPATLVTSNDATLNGTNGPTGAIGHSFWVSTSTFSTASQTIPSGVYSTPDLGAIAANTAFSALLSSLTTAGVPGNLPAITPNTTYYYVAWADIGGTWYAGAQQSFSTTNGSAPATPGVTTNNATGVTMSDATLNGTNGPVGATQESFWVSLAPFSTASPNIPAGVYSTPVLPPVAANGTFSDPLSLVTTNGIMTGGVPGNLSAITPNTTYYFAAWSNVNGTWYPGAVLNFTTTNTGTTGLGSISGETYNDLNKNQTLDSGEPGIAGFTINLYQGAGWWGTAHNNPVFMSAVTDANGNYSFSGLADGTYSVEEINMPAWHQDTSDYNSIVVSNGAAVANTDFANTPKKAGEKEKDHGYNGNGYNNHQITTPPVVTPPKNQSGGNDHGNQGNPGNGNGHNGSNNSGNTNFSFGFSQSGQSGHQFGRNK